MENNLLNSHNAQEKLEALAKQTDAEPEVIHNLCVSCILSGVSDWKKLESTVLHLLRRKRKKQIN